MKYRALGLGVFVLGVSLPPALGVIYKDGVSQKGIQVASVDDTTVIDEEKQLIVFQDPESSFTEYMGCNRAKGTSLTWSSDRKWVACCLAGQTLEGSSTTSFECCGAGHVLVGNGSVGYRCCPRGQEFDGEKCKDPLPVCKNGQVLVDGKCVCPSGTVQAADGSCQRPAPPARCSSEITSGNCYLFKMDNGQYLGYSNRGWYSASKPSNAFQPGKFKLCRDESCAAATSVNPGDGVRIQDLHGEANSGKDPNHWLNGAQNGGHIGKTPQYSAAGVFTITKWTPGKYCLGGFETGVGPTCPSDDPAVTFNTLDKQSCVPIELVPVPCDIRDVDNNCLWTGNQKPCPAGHTCTPIGTGGGQVTTPTQCPAGSTWNGASCVVTTNPAVHCPAGSAWDGAKCVGTGHTVTCPSGSTWNGASCIGTGQPTVTCPSGSTWNGANCVGTTAIPGGGGSTGPSTTTCPPGQSWKGGKCYLPITDCANRARPEFGDTSYNPADFPCSAGRERPCRGEQVKAWTAAVLPWGGTYIQPGPPKPHDIEVNYDYDIIMSIVDVEAQSEHFLLKLDGEFFGETGGENGYKNLYVGNYNDPEWCLLNGYTRGYFRIPRGKHTITIEWPQGTGKYKAENGGNWGYGIARYRFDRLCDPDNCLPACAEKKQKEAEEARAKLGTKKSSPHEEL